MLLDPNLGLAKNVVIPLSNRNGSRLYFYHHWRYVPSHFREVVLSLFSWNLKGKLKHIRNLFLRGIDSIFLLLHNCESWNLGFRSSQL
jgi:hypothetical protein